jgi:hypothetical protein
MYIHIQSISRIVSAQFTVKSKPYLWLVSKKLRIGFICMPGIGVNMAEKSAKRKLMTLSLDKKNGLIV